MFLDRDDTLMHDVPYCRRPEDVRLMPGAATAVRRIHELGYLAIVITNQSGIARGLFTDQELAAVNAELERLLAEEGAHLDAVYYCPHLPTAGCLCRKPGTLLFEQACRDHGIDARRSLVVGDRLHDIEAGRRIGARTILLRNERNTKELEGSEVRPDAICADLSAFASSLPAPTR